VLSGTAFSLVIVYIFLQQRMFIWTADRRLEQPFL
jgi:hypothetical protein